LSICIPPTPSLFFDIYQATRLHEHGEEKGHPGSLPSGMHPGWRSTSTVDLVEFIVFGPGRPWAHRCHRVSCRIRGVRAESEKTYGDNTAAAAARAAPDANARTTSYSIPKSCNWHQVWHTATSAVKLLATNRLTWLVCMAKPASKIGSFFLVGSTCSTSVVSDISGTHSPCHKVNDLEIDGTMHNLYSYSMLFLVVNQDSSHI
jgi:hypothetical protein